MIVTFVIHTTRQLLRSSALGRTIAIKVALAVFTMIVVGYSLAFGLSLERIIVDSLRSTDAISFLNGILVYYFICEFAARYFIQ